MARLPINWLSKRERSQLEGRWYSVDELTALHAALERGQRRRIRAFLIAACLVFAISVVLVAMTGSLTGLTPAFVFAAAAVLVLDVLCLVAVWVLGIALYAWQFNRAIDRGYPELAGRLHL